MASFNKQSVREELERLKSDYKKQSEDGNKIPAETTALITGLFLLIELKQRKQEHRLNLLSINTYFQD